MVVEKTAEEEDNGDTDLCCSFSYWMLQLGVGRHRISRGRGGNALRTWREDGQSERKIERGAPSSAEPEPERVLV